jgi:hypothetical protein
MAFGYLSSLVYRAALDRTQSCEKHDNASEISLQPSTSSPCGCIANRCGDSHSTHCSSDQQHPTCSTEDAIRGHPSRPACRRFIRQNRCTNIPCRNPGFSTNAHIPSFPPQYHHGQRTTSIDLYAHGESVPDPRNPRGEAQTQCTFALADYDPSLPLHLFATLKLRDRDSQVASLVEDKEFWFHAHWRARGCQGCTGKPMGPCVPAEAKVKTRRQHSLVKE